MCWRKMRAWSAVNANNRWIATGKKLRPHMHICTMANEMTEICAVNSRILNIHFRFRVSDLWLLNCAFKLEFGLDVSFALQSPCAAVSEGKREGECVLRWRRLPAKFMAFKLKASNFLGESHISNWYFYLSFDFFANRVDSFFPSETSLHIHWLSFTDDIN